MYSHCAEMSDQRLRCDMIRKQSPNAPYIKPTHQGSWNCIIHLGKQSPVTSMR